MNKLEKIKKFYAFSGQQPSIDSGLLASCFGNDIPDNSKIAVQGNELRVKNIYHWGDQFDFPLPEKYISDVLNKWYSHLSVLKYKIWESIKRELIESKFRELTED